MRRTGAPSQQDAKYTADLFGRLYVSDKAARTE